VLSHALLVRLDAVDGTASRNTDVAFVGRLVPWKAAALAVRTMRYVQNASAVLRIYGYGDERPAILDAARRWGVAGRVQLEGQIPRRELVARIARAGVVLHPALHEEAGFAVAETLALGTPLVCLFHGGPAEIVGQWPDTPATTVTPRGPDATARALAAAIDRHLASPPPVLAEARSPRVSFAGAILQAYEQAAGDPRR
jgi:glycosyltransferase involved in cell wall biosynthesis